MWYGAYLRSNVGFPLPFLLVSDPRHAHGLHVDRMEGRVQAACTAITELLGEAHAKLVDYTASAELEDSDSVEAHLKQYGVLIGKQREIVQQVGFARWSQFQAAVAECLALEDEDEPAGKAESVRKSIHGLSQMQRCWDGALDALEQSAAVHMCAGRSLQPGDFAPPVRLPFIFRGGEDKEGMLTLAEHTQGPVLLTFLRHFG